VAAGGVLAGRSIGHAVDNVQFSFFLCGNVEVGHGETTLLRAAGERRSRRTGAAGARARARAKAIVGARARAIAGARAGGAGRSLGDSTRDTLLGTTLAKAGAKAVATGETRELEATIAGERTSSEISPAETLLLVIVTLVGGSTRAGVAFLRTPVRSSGLNRGQKREERERRKLHLEGRR